MVSRSAGVASDCSARLAGHGLGAGPVWEPDRAVTNPRSEQMLLRQGFTRQTVEIPEALGGGGTVEVFSEENWGQTRIAF